MQTTTHTDVPRRRTRNGIRPMRPSEMIVWTEYTRPALRLMRGQTTKSIAEKCGLCPSTVRRIRKLETIAPRFETIMKILRAYGAKITGTWP